MDAVQRMRQQAYDYGYLRSSQYDQVVYHGPGSIEIVSKISWPDRHEEYPLISR